MIRHFLPLTGLTRSASICKGLGCRLHISVSLPRGTQPPSPFREDSLTEAAGFERSLTEKCLRADKPALPTQICPGRESTRGQKHTCVFQLPGKFTGFTLEHKGHRELSQACLCTPPAIPSACTEETAKEAGIAHNEFSAAVSNTLAARAPFVRQTRKWLFLNQAQMLSCAWKCLGRNSLFKNCLLKMLKVLLHQGLAVETQEPVQNFCFFFF